jgi:hypothetical protein
MKYSLLLGYTATLVFSANIVAAKSVTPVEQIARGAAIEIKKALADINKAIKIIPSYGRSYSNRDFLKSERFMIYLELCRDFK